MHCVPNWLLWIVVVAAAVLGPFASMLLLFFAGEVLWDGASAIGAPAALSLCVGVVAGLLLSKMRPRPPRPLQT